MQKAIDMTGQRYGRWIVLESAGTNRNRTALWLCQCDCGTRRVITGRSLRSGESKSCGCLQREAARKTIAAYNSSPDFKPPDNTTHGQSHTRLYSIWGHMKKRCINPSYEHYDRYGGRGITVCHEWLDDFQTFYDWAMANGYDDTLTIDRIDNDGSYTPDNCRWVSIVEQARNRSTSIHITHDGETKTLKEWCQHYGRDYKAAHARYKRGDSFEAIFAT